LTDAGNNFDLLILAARLGSEAIAERAAALLEPWLSRSRSARASMALLRAYRSKGLERVEFAKTAAHEFEQLAWPLHRARALELCGESESESALNIYRECGAAADVVRLSSRKQSASASVLSKREVEVAGLVAEGNSNRAIAEKLVLSERTVENHIASVFSKLNVRSRAEIAAFVARENAPRKT
jgi:DNA-binding NarL/FixJ family response regulator